MAASTTKGKTKPKSAPEGKRAPKAAKPARTGKSRAARPQKAKPALRAASKRKYVANDARLPKLRAICLELPETSEVEAWGHPTFRVNGKIFAGYGAEGERASMSVKTTPDLQAALVASDARFTIAPYVGKHGWVALDLSDRVDWGEIATLVRGSYRLVAPDRLAKTIAEAGG